MVWALSALFIVAALLFLYSYYSSKRAQKAEQREIDTVYISMMEEVNKLQSKIRNLELESEINAQRAGMTKEDLHLLREILDLYKRNYTLEGIATKFQLEKQEVEQLIAPYMTKNEGRKVANES
jgi:Holliday junction resolvasome RuvABC ATP-dependent DNA helicase subunit